MEGGAGSGRSDYGETLEVKPAAIGYARVRGTPKMEIMYHHDNGAVLDRLADQAFDRKEWFDLKTQAERLSLTEGFERLLSLEVLNLELFEHQRRAVLRVLRELRGRAVLADEVGLGKTIEAGVVLKEYLLRGLIRRVLLLVPASLVSQWRLELRDKLELSFQIGRTGEDFRRGELVLASIDTAKRSTCSPEILDGVWDMVVVDEAHRLKNQKTLNWRFVNSIQKKYLLLLTATPIQNDLRELYNLVTLLKPGQLKTFSQFKRSFMQDKHSPKNTTQLKAALSEVMVRSGRRESLLPFPKREVRTLLVELSQPERVYYNAVLESMRQAYRAMPKEKRNMLPLILVLREVCSHPSTALKSLKAMCGKKYMRTLTQQSVREWGEQVRSVTPAKVNALLGFLRKRTRPAIVFTEFRETQRELMRVLEAEGYPCHAFHGGLDPQEKEEVIAAFRERGGLLVSTESGGEGRNLQFCSTVINYDLPWNPMRVEQRIGRVHRLGQRQRVEVINMVLEGAIDRYVLYLLEKKIQMFHRVIGEVDEILTGLERSFEHSVAEAVLTSGAQDDLHQRIEAFGEELERAYQRYDNVRRLNQSLFERVPEGVGT